MKEPQLRIIASAETRRDHNREHFPLGLYAHWAGESIAKELASWLQSAQRQTFELLASPKLQSILPDKSGAMQLASSYRPAGSLLIVSPTVFRELGFRVLFYSNEESRMHVHVFTANGQAKFWLEPKIELAENYGLRSGEIGKAQSLIEEHYDEIKRRWQEHFGS